MSGLTWTVPSPAVPSAPPKPDAVQAGVYGVDLQFDGNLRVGKAGDYLCTTGKDNLRAAIYRRLMTAPGEFAPRPGYGVGVPMYLKRRATQAVLDELRQRILDQLPRDDRIDAILEVQVVDATQGDRTGVRIYIKVRALGEVQAFPYTIQGD